MARRMGVGNVLRVNHDGRIFVTEALHRRLDFLGKPPEIDRYAIVLRHIPLTGRNAGRISRNIAAPQ